MRSRPPNPPYQQALGLLVRREHSQRELRRKLSARGVESAAAAEAVEKLSEQGYQSDARFAGSLIRSRAGRGYGPAYVRAEFASHGIAEAVAEAALAEADVDWLQVAIDLVARRFTSAELGDRARRLKAEALLLRRGFDGGVARAALARIVDGVD